MSEFKQLINPHSHTHFSLDGAATVEDIVKRNKELGATYVSVTEHGNMNSALELFEKTKKHGMKPICGIELYVQPPFLDEIRKIVTFEVEKSGKAKDAADLAKKVETAMKNEYVHLTVHFKDEWAYQYFCRLSPVMESRAVVKWGERKPIATIDEIRGASGHITICSSCLIGMTQKFILPRKKSGIVSPELAEKAYQTIREIAGKDDFYVEIFPHEITHEWSRPDKDKPGTGKFVPHECTQYAPDGDIQKPANEFMLHLAKKYDDPVVISLDSHFAYPEQKIVQDARLGNGDENWKFYNSYHILTSEEAFKSVNKTLKIDKKTFEGWIDNSYKFASRFDNFNLTTSKQRWVLQPLPPNWQELLLKYIEVFGRMDWNNPAMLERLKYEIDILANNSKINLMSYFFTVMDIADFCRKNDVLMNVRGSAGGSLLLYLVGVSAVNPLKHNLSFERFLTAGRIKANTLPDVDMDISDQDKVFTYLQEKYGDAFCRISVDSQLKLKSSIKDAERAKFGKVRPETEKLCKTLKAAPQGMDDWTYVFGGKDELGNPIIGLIETHKGLKEYSEANEEIWKQVTEMLGVIRQKSQHACGVVIADKPVQEYVPTTIVSGVRVTGFSPKQLEAAGLVKLDLLGLNTLRDMNLTIKLIKERHGVSLNWCDLPYSDEVFKWFAEGKTAAVFQFDSHTAVPLLKGIKPQNIDGLSATTALGRPGTTDAPESATSSRTLADVFVARAQGEKIRYVNEDLEPILKETYGIALYQEQTIQVFRDLAQYTAEEGEAVRRGIGKKDAELLARCTKDLKDKVLARGWTEEQVQLLMDQVMASARYSFNKSHSTSYAYVAYAGMYLKIFYPLEFWTAILTFASKDDMKGYWKHVEDYVRYPDISKSKNEFYIAKDGDKEYIQAPINLIDGVGPATAKEIVGKAPYKSLEDFVLRVNRRIVNKKIVTRLIFSGTMDSLMPPGLNDAEKLDLYLQTKSIVDNEKKEPVPAQYLSFTPLMTFLFKKSIFKVFKEDVTPLTIPVLVERKVLEQKDSGGRRGYLVYRDYVNKKLDNALLSTPADYQYYIDEGIPATIAMVVYVSEVEEKSYADGQKTMLRMVLESGDAEIKTVKFPSWGENDHGVDKDIEGSVALVVMTKRWDKNDFLVDKILKIEKIENF